MTSFKLNIADKSGKCYKTEVKDAQAAPFMGLNIGEKIEGSKIGIEGYEFSVTGGTDFCGFPMRHGILGIRKKITIYKGTGFKGGLKGIKKRKTVCGHKINDTISAINLKVLKEGTKKLPDLFGEEKKEEGKAEEKPKEEKPEAKQPEKEAKPESKEVKKEEPKKESKAEEKQPEEAKPQKEAKSEKK